MVNLAERDMMRILQTGTCKKNTEHRTQNTDRNSLGSGLWALGSFLKGFTLIELIVVIFIISLVTALVMPSFWDAGESSLKTETRRIANTMRYIYDEAINRKQTYLFEINLDNESWRFEGKKESRRFLMKRKVEIKDVLVPSLGEVSRGKVTIAFGPLGPEEPIILHLLKDRLEYTIIFNHLNGRAKILEGYIL